MTLCVLDHVLDGRKELFTKDTFARFRIGISRSGRLLKTMAGQVSAHMRSMVAHLRKAFVAQSAFIPAIPNAVKTSSFSKRHEFQVKSALPQVVFRASAWDMVDCSKLTRQIALQTCGRVTDVRLKPTSCTSQNLNSEWQ